MKIETKINLAFAGVIALSLSALFVSIISNVRNKREIRRLKKNQKDIVEFIDSKPQPLTESKPEEKETTKNKQNDKKNASKS